MSHNIIKLDHYDPALLALKVEKTGTGKLVKISESVVHSGKDFMLEIPWSLTANGLERYAFNDSEPKYIIDVQPAPEIAAKFCRTDNIIMDQTFKNSYKLFGKKYTEEQRDVVKGLYISPIHNDFPPPRIRLAVEPVFKNGKRTDIPNATLYRKGNTDAIETKTFEELQRHIDKNSMIKAIIKPYAWSKYKEKYGLKWCVVQLLVEKLACEPNMFSTQTNA